MEKHDVALLFGSGIPIRLSSNSIRSLAFVGSLCFLSSDIKRLTNRRDLAKLNGACGSGASATIGEVIKACGGIDRQAGKKGEAHQSIINQ
jgi:hypothetical protein